jgi:hypothetical protein
MDDLVEIFLIFLGSVGLIYVYGLLRSPQGEDVLKTVLVPQTDLDFWSLSHFLLFAFLGKQYPDWIPLIALVGVLWEGAEAYTGDPSRRGDDFRPDAFWYAKLSDMVVDIYSLIFGYLVHLGTTID